MPRAALPERERTLAFLATIEDLNFDPVNEFSYPNTGCRLVEAAVEARGIALETGLMEHFVSPLGVHAAPPWDQADVVPGLVPGYWPGPHGWRHGIPGLLYCAADGVSANPEQFLRWLRALLTGSGPTHGLLERLANLAAFWVWA